MSNIIKNGFTTTMDDCIDAKTVAQMLTAQNKYIEEHAVPGPQGPQGVGFNYMGGWITDNEYHENDVVTSGGALYVCILAVSASTTSPENDPTHWSVMLPAASGGSAASWHEAPGTSDIAANFSSITDVCLYFASQSYNNSELYVSGMVAIVEKTASKIVAAIYGAYNKRTGEENTFDYGLITVTINSDGSVSSQLMSLTGEEINLENVTLCLKW